MGWPEIIGPKVSGILCAALEFKTLQIKFILAVIHVEFTRRIDEHELQAELNETVRACTNTSRVKV